MTELSISGVTSQISEAIPLINKSFNPDYVVFIIQRVFL